VGRGGGLNGRDRLAFSGCGCGCVVCASDLTRLRERRVCVCGQRPTAGREEGGFRRAEDMGRAGFLLLREKMNPRAFRSTTGRGGFRGLSRRC
jgi:hypothetical protein